MALPVGAVGGSSKRVVGAMFDKSFVASLNDSKRGWIRKIQAWISKYSMV